MTTRRRQRGSLLIIAAVLIVVIGFLSTVAVSLSVNQTRTAVEDLGGAQAFYLAESGLERGIAQWGTNLAYTGEGPTTFGGGTFTVAVATTDADGAPLPANQRRFTSTGQVSAAGGYDSRVTEAVAQAAGGGGIDHIVSWREVIP